MRRTDWGVHLEARRGLVRALSRPRRQGGRAHVPRKADAEKFVISIEHDRLSGRFVDPSAGRIALADFVERECLPTMVNLEATTQRETSAICARTCCRRSALASSP